MRISRSRRGFGVGPHAIFALHAPWPAAAVIREMNVVFDLEDAVIQKTSARTPPCFWICELGPIDRKTRT